MKTHHIYINWLLRTVILFVFLCDVSYAGGRDTIPTQYDINDPRNPNCPCHKLQQQADEEYLAMMRNNKNVSVELENVQQTNTIIQRQSAIQTNESNFLPIQERETAIREWKINWPSIELPELSFPSINFRSKHKNTKTETKIIHRSYKTSKHLTKSFSHCRKFKSAKQNIAFRKGKHPQVLCSKW